MSESTYPRVEYLEFSQLEDNPLNWKFHPVEQLETIRASIDELGHLKPLGTFNTRTRRLLDGHGRKSLYAGMGVVPIWCVDLPEELEARALAILDPSGWTAVPDKAKVSALLARVPKIDHASTAHLLALVKESARLLEPKPEQPQDSPAAEVVVPMDSVFPGGPLGVPMLLPELQATEIPAPVLQWGSQAQDKPHKGSWHFYAWDSKFEVLWKYPGRVEPSGAQVLAEPNFSTVEQTPWPYALWQIYRKRWIARWWQSKGRRILVDLNVSPWLNQPCDDARGRIPNLLGVPEGWASYSTRAHGNSPQHLLGEWELAKRHAGREQPLFLVVGGGRRVKQMAQEFGWLAVDEPVNQALGKAANDGEETQGPQAAEMLRAS